MRKSFIVILLMFCILQTSYSQNVKTDELKSIEGYEWLEGEWIGTTQYNDWVKIIITPTTYKAVRCNLDGDVNVDNCFILFEDEKPLAIGLDYNYIRDQEILALDNKNPLIGIDEYRQCVYAILDEYHIVRLEKSIKTKNFSKFLKNISWAYGEWVISANHKLSKSYHVKITPFYYQVSTNDKDSSNDIFLGRPKIWYSLKGENIIDNIYFNHENKNIKYITPKGRFSMEQTVKYTTIKVIYWVIIVVLFIGLLILIKNFIKITISIIKKIIACMANMRKRFTTTIKVYYARTKENCNEKVKSIINLKNIKKMSKKEIVAGLLTLALILGIVVLHRNYYGQEFEKTHSEHISRESKESNESNSSLSKRERLKREYRKLREQYDNAVRKSQSPYISYKEHQNAVKEIEGIRRQIARLEAQAQAMGIPSLIYL